MEECLGFDQAGCADARAEEYVDGLTMLGGNRGEQRRPRTPLLGAGVLDVLVIPIGCEADSTHP